MSAEVVATVKADLNAIKAALDTAAAALITATNAAAGDLAGALAGLTQAQIDQLAASVQSALNAINQLQVIIGASVTGLGPALALAVLSELNAVRAAIAPFVNPLVSFVNSVKTFGASLTLAVNGLAGVVNSLTTAVNNLLNSLGLGQLLGLLFP